MAKIIQILKIYMIFIAVFFMVFALDVFGSTEGNITDEILGFLISILPGLFLLLAIIIGWHKKRILSYLIFLLAIGFFIFFGMYQILESIEIILIIFIPMMLLAILLFIDSKKII